MRNKRISSKMGAYAPWRRAQQRFKEVGYLLEHVPVTIQLMRLALPEVCDDDLHILKLVFRRGAPISAETVQETAAVGRFSVELAAAARKMAVQHPSETKAAHRRRSGCG